MNSAVTWLLIFVLSKSKNAGKDADTWAWIDMLRFERKPLDYGCTMFYHNLTIYCDSTRLGLCAGTYLRSEPSTNGINGGAGPADRL